MTVAFFYHDPVILDRVQHRRASLTPVQHARHAAQAAAAPLLATEFADASREYPIVFVKGVDSQWMALAVTGLKEGENLFVNADGDWTGQYVPASVRRYPLLLSEIGNGQRAVCVDRACAGFDDGLASADAAPGAQRLFNDEGEPTTAMQQFMNMLNDFQAKAEATTAFVKRLEAAGCLVEANLQVNLPDGRSAGLSGVWMVKEAAFQALSDADAVAWFRSGDMALVFMHLVSLRNLGSLLARRA